LSDYFSKSNTGGAIASRGFTYQDYCSLIELFQFIDNDTFKAISIETLDDFTIIINNTEILYQVKKMQFDVKIINKVLEKDIRDKKQKFIFTSKDSSKYNGLFDKVKEYNESQNSSRPDSEKEDIKEDTKKIIKKNEIENAEKYLSSTVLIYEEMNINDILYSKFYKWLELKDFQIEDKDGFLDKLRLTISDKKGNRGELKKEEFYEIVEKFKNDKNKIRENSLPTDQSRYITIELEPIDNDNFKIIIWVESKENNYLEVKFSDDKTYTKNEIVNIIDNFIDKNYKDVSSRKIFLLFSLPTQLMKEDINFWKLEDEKLLGRKYKVLLRGKERFRKDRRSEKLYRYKDWKENWNIIKNKKSMESISKIKCIINKEDNEDINSEEVAETPLVIMKYEPNEESFIRLYKSAIPLVMWANNCVDFNEFENIFDKETHKNIKLCELKEKLYKFIEKRHSKVDANIMLMYDNPNNLAPDGGATRYNIPE